MIFFFKGRIEGGDFFELSLYNSKLDLMLQQTMTYQLMISGHGLLKLKEEKKKNYGGEGEMCVWVGDEGV